MSCQKAVSHTNFCLSFDSDFLFASVDFLADDEPLACNILNEFYDFGLNFEAPIALSSSDPG